MTPIQTELRELLERVCIGYPCRERSDARDELRALLATPADAADMGGQAGEEVERYWHVPNQGFRKLDPAYYADEPGYVAHEDFERILAQHRQQAGKLVEALNAIADCTDDDQARDCAIKALADWEKTSCVK